MKKLYLLMVALLVLISFSRAQLTATIGDTANVTPGAVFHLPLTVTKFNNLNAIGMYILIDTTKLTYDSLININPKLQGSSTFLVNLDHTDKIGSNIVLKIAWASYSTKGTNFGNTKLFDIVFNYIGSTSICFDNINCSVSDNGGNILPVTWNCGYIDKTTLITQPVPSISMCAGQSSPSFSVSATGANLGYQWQWDNSNNWYNITDGVIYSGVSESTLTITPPAINNVYEYRCIITGDVGPTVTSDTSQLTVYATPPGAGAVIQGKASVCVGSTGIEYSVLNITNAESYVWTLPQGATITSGNNTDSITVSYSSSAKSGNITVYGINNCGPGQTSPNYAITVNPLPTALTSANGTTTFCKGNNVQLTVESQESPLNYQWEKNGVNITGATTSSYIADSTGNYTVFVVDANGCSAISNSVVVTTTGSYPSAAGTISGKDVVCPGSTGITYSVPSISYATGYTWSLPQGATITSGNNTNSITVSFSGSAKSGNITVYGTDGCGNGQTSPPYAVTVSNTLPTLSGVSQSAAVCSGTNTTINLTGLLATTIFTVYYTINGGPTESATVTSNGSGTGSFTLSVTHTNNGKALVVTNMTNDITGCSSTFSSGNSTNLTVYPLPTAVAQANGPTTLCQGSNVLLTVTSQESKVKYQWENYGETLTGATTSSYNANSTGNYTALVTDTNSCSAISNSIVVTVQSSAPSAAGAINGSDLVCPGSTGIVYTVPSISYATGYTWTLPAGATITSGGNTNSITVSFSNSASSGNITVYGTNICGYGQTSPNYAVTVSTALPTLSGVSQTAGVCSGTNATINLAGLLATTTFTVYYTINGGPTESATVSSDGSGTGSFTVSVTSANNGKELVVTNMTNTGTGCSSTFSSGNSTNLSVYSLPTAITKANGKITFCQGNNVQLTVESQESKLKYQWENNEVNISGATASSYNANSTGNYEVLVTDTNNCPGTSNSITITVNPIPQTPVITFSKNNNTLISSSNVGNQWYFNNTLIKDSTENTFIPNESGNYFVIVTIDSCSSDTSNIINYSNVNVNQLGAGSDNLELKIYPNPLKGFSIISYQLAENCSVNLKIYDMLGKEVITILDERQNKGIHYVSFDGSKMESGVYFVKLISEKKTGVVRLMKSN